MVRYEQVRDILRADPKHFSYHDAAQLFKHAIALWSEAHRRKRQHSLEPILFYLYAEPKIWAKNDKPVDEHAKAQHQAEIERFSTTVVNDEVKFMSCSWKELLEDWKKHPNGRIRAHAQAVTDRFSP